MGPHDGHDRPRCIRHEPGAPYVRDKDGEPADLLCLRDYPVASVCLFCGSRIVTYGMFGRAADWYAEGDADRPATHVRDFRANRG